MICFQCDFFLICCVKPKGISLKYLYKEENRVNIGFALIPSITMRIWFTARPYLLLNKLHSSFSGPLSFSSMLLRALPQQVV